MSSCRLFTLDVPMEEDGVGNAAADPTRSSLDADTDSLLTEALLSPAVSEAARGDLSTDVLQSTLTSDGAPLTDAACTDANKIKKRARKPPPLGNGSDLYSLLLVQMSISTCF